MEKYYGDRLDRRKEYYSRILNSAEESLKRLKTDYLDLFMCPHGANSPEELLIPEIYEALEKLTREDRVKAELIKLRYFAGLTVEQAGRVLGISRATADRYWTFARTWLYYEISKGDEPA